MSYSRCFSTSEIYGDCMRFVKALLKHTQTFDADEATRLCEMRWNAMRRSDVQLPGCFGQLGAGFTCIRPWDNGEVMRSQ